MISETNKETFKNRKRSCLVKNVLFFVTLITLFLLPGCGDKDKTDKSGSVSSDNPSSVRSDESFQRWKKVYLDFINDNYEIWKNELSDRVDRLKYDIIYIDADAIPECVI